MKRTIHAAIVYFGSVFAIGFVVGTVRVLFVVPRLGETLAVCIELPIILLTSWFICRWTIRHFAIVRDVRSRLAHGALAFLLLMSAEFALSVVLFHRTADAYVSTFTSTAGALGLAGQVLFSLFPLVQLFFEPKKL